MSDQSVTQDPQPEATPAPRRARHPSHDQLARNGKMTEIRKIAVDAMPSDLDPDRNPIIAEHFFGWRRLGDVTAGIIRDLRRRRNEAGALSPGAASGTVG